MATVTEERGRAAKIEADLRWGSWLMGAAAVGFIVYGAIFLVRNFTDSFLELGIGPGQVNVGKEQIQNFSPSLYQYISHLQIAVSGFIAATGLAVLFLSAYGVRRGLMWAWVGAVAAPVLGLLVALPAHYPNHFDTLGHLGLIYLATLIFLVAFGVRRGQLWAWVGAVSAPVLGLAVALPAHYPNHFDTLGHLGLIYLATLIFLVGALLALRGLRASQKA